MTLTVGAKTTSLPFSLTSSPTTEPCRKAMRRSKLAARERGDALVAREGLEQEAGALVRREPRVAPGVLTAASGARGAGGRDQRQRHGRDCGNPYGRAKTPPLDSRFRAHAD